MSIPQPDTDEGRPDAEPTILIASGDTLATWSAGGVPPSDLLALADADAPSALAVIELRRPQVVVLEHTFAASVEGATFVRELRAKSGLAGLDIRVLPAARSAELGRSGPVAGHVLADLAQPLAAGPTRRAPRIALPDGALVRVDGTSAALVNVSAFGVQAVSPSLLKPNQQVDLVLDLNGVKLRTRAQVAWSTLELGRNAVSYRAGIAFATAQPEIVKLEARPRGLVVVGGRGR